MVKVLQLNIQLEEVAPKIWRRFLVYDSISFEKLHEIIQEIMGWDSYHLYSFDLDGIRIELPDEEGYLESESKNSKKIKLSDYLKYEKQELDYVYDFGDNWEHKIVIEKILEDDGKQKIPLCTDGERACPPEDCGGSGGYERFIELLKTGKDPWGEDPEELKEWLGEWDPNYFDVGKVNKRLK